MDYQTNLVTFVLVARIPAEGIEDFRAYEDAVLPLLPRFNGRLERQSSKSGWHHRDAHRQLRIRYGFSQLSQRSCAHGTSLVAGKIICEAGVASDGERLLMALLRPPETSANHGDSAGVHSIGKSMYAGLASKQLSAPSPYIVIRFETLSDGRALRPRRPRGPPWPGRLDRTARTGSGKPRVLLRRRGHPGRSGPIPLRRSPRLK